MIFIHIRFIPINIDKLKFPIIPQEFSLYFKLKYITTFIHLLFTITREICKIFFKFIFTKKYYIIRLFQLIEKKTLIADYLE